MSSDYLEKLIEKKGNKLSKFLGIDSVPSTQLITNMQSRIKNTIFKLSIEDYEAMCGNKIMVRMMSKVIGCEEKQLKKFCKYINVFKDNINSSPKSIKNKMKVTNSINASMRRGSLHALPDDILEKIVNKYKTLFSRVKYKLKDWIPLEKLNWVKLSSNPNAIELLKANYDEIDWRYLSGNPSTEAIELLKSNRYEIDWKRLSGNPNPNAIELLKKNQTKIDWESLSENPNPKAIELLKKNQGNIQFYYLSKNPNPKAIDMLKANREEIHWLALSENPAIFDEVLE